MSTWSRVQQVLWTGKVVKDYGVISDGSYGAGRRTLSVVLAGKHGKSLFIRASYRAPFRARVLFIDMDRDTLVKLDAALHDALEQM